MSAAARRLALPALAAVAALVGAGPATAQWATLTAEGEAPRATVRNDEGAEVHIRVDDEGRVHATFRLPEGLARLDPAGCPTFQIDDRLPENLATEAHACRVSGASSEVVLAEVLERSVRSHTLLELMNGSRLTVRYRLLRGGYGGTRFTLRHSKQALSDALGEGVQVEGD